MTASILPSVKGSIRTHNETSFAIGFGDANALILDGLVLTGSARAERFLRAKERATTALSYADVDEEKSLARQLLAYIALAEQRRWNY